MAVKKKSSKLELEERINKIINCRSFQSALKAVGYDLIEFQLKWHDYKSFDDLPYKLKQAVWYAENDPY